jgi:phenylacetate-CoA ligase
LTTPVTSVAAGRDWTESVFRDVIIRGFESGVKRRPTFAYWRELERSQWESRAQLERRQLHALQRLVRHAAVSCPYYTGEWRRLGLSPDVPASLDDFRRWPLVTRDTIRAHRERMRAVHPPMRLIAKATGGSSGEPLRFDLDTNSNDRRMAAWMRGYGWAGAGPGTRQFHLWGTALGDQPARKRLKLRLYDALYRRRVASCFQLTESTVPDYLARIRQYAPAVLVGYTNPLYFFARALRERGFRPPPVRSVVVGAEKLHDFQRRTIEEVFEAPVFETYGSREFMLMGAECDRHDGMHLTFEQLLLEVVDDDGQPLADGAEGNVVVTDLYNYGMPFVRYLNGDRAVAGFGRCSCGRGLPTLRQVVGRQLDIVATPDGRRVPGEFFPHLLKDFAVVRRFQVVQERPDAVLLRLVLAGRPGAALDDIRTQVAAVLGTSVTLEVEVVDDIPLSRSGKLQVVVNRLGPGLLRS